MNQGATLTRREHQIAEHIAWGGSKKEIADKLCISERTVENTARNIYEKTGVSKANELSAWWFCKTYDIPFDLSPLKRSITALFLLITLSVCEFTSDFEEKKYNRTARIYRIQRIYRNKPDNDF